MKQKIEGKKNQGKRKHGYKSKLKNFPSLLFPKTTMISKLLIALTLSTAAAYCPNGCSGHGTCKSNPKVRAKILVHRLLKWQNFFNHFFLNTDRKKPQHERIILYFILFCPSLITNISFVFLARLCCWFLLGSLVLSLVFFRTRVNVLLAVNLITIVTPPLVLPLLWIQIWLLKLHGLVLIALFARAHLGMRGLHLLS